VEFVIGTNRRRLERTGVRFRPRLVEADERTVKFADHSILEDAGVVVWATGYRPDYAWIHIPRVVGEGHVIHRRGVTEVPGLYFLGCPGSTPEARPCSASFTTTPPIWQATLLPATVPPRRPPGASPGSRRPNQSTHAAKPLAGIGQGHGHEPLSRPTKRPSHADRHRALSRG
jgi:hypothetical protein